MKNKLYRLKMFYWCALLMTIPLSSIAQKYNIDWVKSIGGAPDVESPYWVAGQGMAVDAQSNVYITGSFGNGSLDFDPGLGTAELSTITANSAFVAKYDSVGNYIWAKNFVYHPGEGNGYTNGESWGTSIAVDAEANVYVTGNFMSMVDFDPGADTFNLFSNGGTDAFIVKLDSAGNFIWAKSIGGTGNDNAFSLALDEYANVYITGYMVSPAGASPNDSIDFDPGPNEAKFLTESLSWMYVLKLDTDGNYVWGYNPSVDNAPLRLMAGLSYGYAITVDVFNNVLVTGSLTKNAHFGIPGTPGMSVNLAPPNDGGRSPFVLKLTSNGDCIWARAFQRTAGRTGITEGRWIKSDASGNVYSSGFFGAGSDDDISGTIDFDPGPGVYELSSKKSEYNVYVSKLNAEGEFVWAKAFGDIGWTFPGGSMLDESSGYIYLSGEFQSIGNSGMSNTVDFDPGPDSFLVGGRLGSYYHYLSILDTAGNFVWARKYGPELMRSNGYNSTSLALSPSGKIYMSGGYVAEANQPEAVVFETEPDTLKLDYTGGSDFYFFKMDRCQIADTLQVKGCTSYTFWDKTYTESGIYTDTLIALSQCDSFITLDISLGQNFQDTLQVSTCDSFRFDNEVYGRSGIYTHVFPTIADCDSTVVLLLDISGAKPDTSVLLSGKTTLTALAPDATYQWLDCDDGYKPVPGATDQSFTPTADGNYALKVSTGESCTDTSACYALKGVTDIASLNGDNRIRIYPNPTTETVHIVADPAIKEGYLRLYDAVGRLMTERRNLNGSNFELDMEPYAPGVYVMEIGESDATVRIKLQKQ